MTITATSELVIEHCCACGIPFAMPRELYRRRRNDHRSFYCPAGHQQHYTGKSREERLEQQLSATRDMLETARHNRDHYKRSAARYKGEVTRVRRRIAHGTCPCCGRTFKQLQRHMERQHPEYVAAHGAHDAGES